MTGNFAARGPVPPPYGPYPPPSKPSKAGVWLGAIACVLATAALVVGVVAFNAARRGQATASPAMPEKQAELSERAQVFLDSADRSLCTEVGPLMKESRQAKNTFSGVGPQGSPQHRAATAKFVSETSDWANRTQQVLNERSNGSRYLTRTVQRYIDDMLLFVGTIAPDRDPEPADSQAWDLSIVDLRGPRGRCRDVGVDWWN
jgi:hypothetical protein